MFNVDFIYNGKKKSCRSCVDMPVIANSKMKEDSIFNIMQFKITDLGYENVTLTNRKYIKIH